MISGHCLHHYGLYFQTVGSANARNTPIDGSGIGQKPGSIGYRNEPVDNDPTKLQPYLANVEKGQSPQLSRKVYGSTSPFEPHRDSSKEQFGFGNASPSGRNPSAGFPDTVSNLYWMNYFATNLRRYHSMFTNLYLYFSCSLLILFSNWS